MFQWFFKMYGYLDFTSLRSLPSYHLRGSGPTTGVNVPIMFPTNRHVPWTPASRYTGVPVRTMFLLLLLAQSTHKYGPHTSVAHSYVLVALHTFTDFSLLRREPAHKDVLYHLTYTPVPIPVATNPYFSPYTLPPAFNNCMLSNDLWITPTLCSYFIGINRAHTIPSQYIHFIAIPFYDTARPSYQYETAYSTLCVRYIPYSGSSHRTTAPSLPLSDKSISLYAFRYFLPFRSSFWHYLSITSFHAQVVQRTLPFLATPSCAAPLSCTHLSIPSVLVRRFHILRQFGVQRSIKPSKRNKKYIWPHKCSYETMVVVVRPRTPFVWWLPSWITWSCQYMEPIPVTPTKTLWRNTIPHFAVGTMPSRFLTVNLTSEDRAGAFRTGLDRK